MKNTIILLFIALMFSSCTAHLMHYQYGESVYNPCPQCEKVEIKLENPSDVDVVFQIEGHSYQIAPGKKKKIYQPLNMIEKGDKLVSAPTLVEVSFNGYTERLKLYPGQGYDLRPWMFHCYEVRPF